MFNLPPTPFTPVTPAEVSKAICHLTNERTKDSENLYGEFFQYSGDALTEPICTIINQIFLTHTPLHITLTSQLFCLNKPKGSPTVQNLRPLTLMSIFWIRSILLLINIFPRIRVLVVEGVLPTIYGHISIKQLLRKDILGF